ncbi:PH domain-containing protein [Solirubrobacter pauli]|uniref:PH domain-containing protein n=1 Tax=Solirubrobacter pauli TaxID=166793 RepID=UPI000EAC532B|nr:PH domain-containing protein [Solirubrobacter pauli]
MRRLHPAAIAIYSASALGNLALPLAVILGTSVLGGGLDFQDLMRTVGWGAAGLVAAVVMGYVRWSTTQYWISQAGISHHTGLLSKKDTNVPFDRIQALDVQQGVLQRWFGVQRVDVQTGAGGKGGEISLPALLPDAVAELRALRPSVVTEEADGVSRSLTPRELVAAAFTAGQLGIVLPVLAVLGQAATQVAEEEGGENAVQLIPETVTGWVVVAVALLALAWVLSTLGAFIAFAGFTVTRGEDRLRIRRGLLQRSEATVPLHRIRAVRVVEGVFRRPFGLCALSVEVTGYAEEASAARTLFPLVRVSEVQDFLDELLPEMGAAGHGEAPGRAAADGRGERALAGGGRRSAGAVVALDRPPARAARRYVAPPLLGALVLAGAGWLVVGPFSLFALVLAPYGWARWRAAGWHFADGRLAVRTLRIARITILAPARYRESHTWAQNVFQRRAALADLEVAFGKRTTARIRHLDAATAQAAWSAL